MFEDVMTGRHILRDRQYAGPANLAARQRLWRYRSGPPQVTTRLDVLALAGHETILDVGCGNGAYLAELRRRRHTGRLVGLDLSPGMARACADGADSATGPVVTAVADAVRLPVADAACDAALAMHMLYHVPQPPAAIAELRRVLRPGGTLLASTNGSRHIQEILAVIDAAASAVTGRRRTPPAFSFTLESGAAPLSASFAEVEKVEEQDTAVVPAAEPVVAYIASFEPEHCGVPPGPQWTELLRVAADLVADQVRQHGVFPVTAHTGVFICR